MKNILAALGIVIASTASAQVVQYLGSPTTTVRNRGNFVSDSLFYLPKRQKAPSDTGAVRYSISDSTVYVWTGTQWRAVSVSGLYVPYTGATADVDIDGFSLNAKSVNIEGTGGAGHLGLKHQSGTPTLSANLSAVYANTNGDLAWHNDNLYSATFKTSNITAARTYTFQNKSYVVADSADVASKVNISDTATMLNAYTRGSGTVNYLPKFTGTRTFGNSQIQDDGYKVNIGSQFYFNPTKKTFSIGLDDSTRNISITTYDDAFKINQLDTLTKNNIIELQLNKSVATNTRHAGINFLQSNGSANGSYRFYTSDTIANRNYHSWLTATTPGSQQERMRLKQDGELIIDSVTTDRGSYIFQANGSAWVQGSFVMRTGEMLVNTNNDAGAYALQVTGSIYNTTGAVFAASSGNVGIGTTPSYKLDVITSATGNVAQFGTIDGSTNPRLVISSSTSGITFTETYSIGSAQGFIFVTNATERARITGDGEVLIGGTSDAGAYALQVAGSIYNTTGAVLAASSGNVGISETSPAQKLHLGGSSTQVIRVNGSSVPAYFGTSEATVAQFSANRSPIDGSRVVTANGASYISATATTGGGEIIFATSSSNIDASESMRLNGSKELLLNISDQGAYTLQVLDNATIRGGAPYLEIRDNSTNALHYFEGTDNGLVIWADLSNIAASSIIGFNIDGTEKMRLTSAAELLIGSSTDAGAYALQVTGSTYTTAGGVFNPTASSSNYLLMGTTTVRETSGIARGAIQVTGSAGNTGGIIIAGQLANNANGDYLQFIKSRGTSNVAVQSGDDLGGITLAGADGTNYLRGARIRAVVDGTPGTNDMPTRLEFSVTQDGNASPTYWMALNNDGELIIQENPVDAGAYKLQVAGNIYSTGSLTTGAPSGGSIKPWKIGEAATVSPTSPNRTIRVEIDGTVYYIHAKTTND